MRLLPAGGSIEVGRIGDRERINSDVEEMVAQAVGEVTIRRAGTVSSEGIEARV